MTFFVLNMFILCTAMMVLRQPIFHCDAKPFVLGTFALPAAKYTNMLVSFASGDANISRHPTQNPKCNIFVLAMYISSFFV